MFHCSSDEHYRRALNFLAAMGLFIGQSPAFFAFLRNLAEEADAAKREGEGGILELAPNHPHSHFRSR